MNDSQTVLVVGGAGFIGANFCRKLNEKSWQVICLDNFVTSSRDNIQELEKNPNFSFLEFDIRQDVPDVETHRNKSLQYVVNLACPASPVDYQNLPQETLEVSSLGTQNLLELARNNQA